MSPAEKDGVSGRVAIVTGGSFGIGLATAHRLAAGGARLALFARGRARLDAAAAALTAAAGPGSCMTVAGDVTDEDDVARLFDETAAHFGTIDIVVCNAGFHHGSPFAEIRMADWQSMLAVHAGGTFLVARAAFRFWQRRDRGGVIVIVASKSAVAATKGAAAYAAAKAAQLHLGRCLAEEGGPLGIRVNAVLPDGVIEGTGIYSPEQRLAAARRHGIAPDALEDFYASRNALNRRIRPDDVAQAIIYLASGAASAVNGAAITVDGGVAAAYLR